MPGFVTVHLYLQYAVLMVMVLCESGLHLWLAKICVKVSMEIHCLQCRHLQALTLSCHLPTLWYLCFIWSD